MNIWRFTTDLCECNYVVAHKIASFIVHMGGLFFLLEEGRYWFMECTDYDVDVISNSRYIGIMPIFSVIIWPGSNPFQ